MSFPHALLRHESTVTLEFPWGTLTWMVCGQLGNSRSMTVGKAVLTGGYENPRHRHPNCDEVLHVLSGHIEHDVGDETFELRTGDTLTIPAGVWHQARALGKTDAVMMICFSSADRETEMADGRPM